MTAFHEVSKRREDHEEATDTLLSWVTEFSADRWGRWDNEVGAANFITDKKRMHATRLVTKGVRTAISMRCVTISCLACCSTDLSPLSTTPGIPTFDVKPVYG